MTETRTPNWQPVPMFADMIDAAKAIRIGTIDRILEMGNAGLCLAFLTGKGFPGQR